MATTTLVNMANSTSSEVDASRYARIVNVARNMKDCKYNKDSKIAVPVRTTVNPSPLKKSASNRHPGQTHTRTPVDEAIAHEMAKARYHFHDLADHVLGHIVSTELARDILHHLVNEGVVHVFVRTGMATRNNRNHKTPLNASCNEVAMAIEEAFEDADEHDCIELGIDGNNEEPESSSANTKGKGKRSRTSAKRKGKRKTMGYSFKWTTFPAEPLREDELVSFLNSITDRAFAFAESKLGVAKPELRHRFATLQDKHHAMPLSYEPDGEDMRPDFLLLPISAFTDKLEVVDGRYVNFTASRLVGESKNKDVSKGLGQVQRYARGLKRAQPWVYYVLGMMVTRDKAVFLRGEGSGIEHVEVSLEDGRGCIEFIRILLGLALADKVDLGHNPDVLVEGKEQGCLARNVTCHPVASNAATSRASLRSGMRRQAFSAPNPLSRMAVSGAVSRWRGALTTVSRRAVAASSISSKRVHSEVEDDSDEEMESKKRRTEETVTDVVNRMVFSPAAVYGYESLGVLFTTSSIRGRGTTVFCVADDKNKGKLLALKMAWQDLGRLAEQDVVMEKLTSKGHHANLTVPFRTFKAERNGKTCTTLGAIRGFSDDQIGDLNIENRALTVSVLDLRRPVMYFWGVHDFVRGLRGALLGHEYLTKIGILHRDVSENNIVLGLRPGDERGYLIDLDMAILQEAEEPTPASPAKPQALFWRRAMESSTPSVIDNKKPMKGLRTGTFPYISHNVLLGGRHTHFDDVESFLYVLLLFFFSYAGPLSDVELREADKIGFAQSVGSGRLSHMRNWPKQYSDWADGDAEIIGQQKGFLVTGRSGAMHTIKSVEFQDCLKNNWPEELHIPISDLVRGCFTIFWNSAECTAAEESRTEVSHAVFISTLEEWMDIYSDLEDRFSNCPFKQGT